MAIAVDPTGAVFGLWQAGKHPGGDVLFPPQDSPFGRFAVLRDPQGATFNAIRLPATTQATG